LGVEKSSTDIKRRLEGTLALSEPIGLGRSTKNSEAPVSPQLHPHSSYFSALKRETAHISRTLYQTTRRYTLEGEATAVGTSNRT
jgi:hypothetical protein